MGHAAIVIQPPLRVSRDFIDYPYHSDLGAVQAAAVLRAAGIEVALVDAFAVPGQAPACPDSIVMGAPVSEVLARVDAGAGVVVVHYTPFHRPPGRDPLLGELLAGLRAAGPDRPIVVADLYQSGEHHVEAPGQAVLAAYPEVDVCLKYEAEADLPRLVRDLLATGRPERPRFERGREPPELDALPLPAWDLVDLEARDACLARVVEELGRGAWAFPVDGRTLPMLSSRGCPYRCAHCSSNPGRPSPSAPKTQRRYSPEYLRRAVAELVTVHGATRIELLDEMANVRPAHFEALLEALGGHDVGYDFPNGMRADWVERRHLEAMRGRISTLSVSAESGVQRVVDEVVGKQLDLQAVERTIRSASELGIPTLAHFIIGMPGETKPEINGTLAYAIHLWEAYGTWPSVQFATPLPGTALEARAVEASGPLPEVRDWSPLFQHRPVTSSPEFTPDELRRFKWTFDERLHAGRGPTKVIMNVTYRCNNHCTFCATGNRTSIDGDFPSQRAVLAAYRKRGLWQVDFDGGEPTLHPKLIPLVRYARRIGYSRVNVTTNGRRCAYQDYAERLVGSGLTTLLFSVHGADAQTHAQNVGVAEAFDQTLSGIQNCVRLAPDGVELGMNITITKSNHTELPKVAALAYDLGLRWLNVQFLTPFGRATIQVSPDTAEAARIAMRVIDEYGDRMKFQIINLPFCFMPGYERHMLGDLLKIQRHMVFVNNIDVNLFNYLKEQRAYHEECQGCPHKSFCGGFYELRPTREPELFISEADTRLPAAAGVEA
jgi:MoaA/NifB/PqqE/SkfB family radical SAM enzyme